MRRGKLAITHRLAETTGFLDIRTWNLGFAAVGTENSRWFIGAFDHWIEIPDTFASTTSESDFAWTKHHDVDYLIGGFIVVFFLWQCMPETMARHCAASWWNLRAGRIWSVALAQLSHASLHHLLMNIIFLYSVGPEVYALLGRRRFFALYFAGGVCSIFVSLVVWRLLKGAFVEHLGASGSIYSLFGYLAATHRSGFAHLLGHEWSLNAVFLAALLLSSSTAGIDVVAHGAGFWVGWTAAKQKIFGMV
jgi:membrane associated rhomboid family serine protease